MGLINWFKDKVIQSLEHDVRLLKADIERLDASLEACKTQIASLRTKLYRTPESSLSGGSIEEIKAMFGGRVPIEFQEGWQGQRNPKE